MTFRHTPPRFAMFSIVSAVWFSAQLLIVAPAAAAPTAAERETARALMDEGDRQRATGDLRGAMVRYEAAHAIMHIPTTALELARVQAQLGLLVEARSAAVEGATFPGAPNEPRVFAEARREATRLAAELEARIPALSTTVTPSAATYTLLIDGVALPAEARDVEFHANPGAHTITVEAPGYVTETRQVALDEAQHRAVAVSLAKLPQTVSPRAAAQTVADSEARTRAEVIDTAPGRTRAIVGFGIGGAALATGIVTGIISIAQTNSAKAACEHDRCDSMEMPRLSTANTLANVANVGIPLGLLGIAYGVYELLTLPKPDTRRGLSVQLTNHGTELRGAL